ncbi:hypothetical protein PHAVU_008G204200 [Phaseolus vulgaris]|uniref:PGG domain-containing protein n=1 Tax=Phaseolus vulgaris TaxID=3885 RepID=V7BAN1_PHAVU|nr:hypothetical protein PHAVU_008G204200g [Phaseolus vulgaris]ESW13526.1 hypothetical protein PHAVU_008G204200g [Phaseolus vulgaris]
MLAVHLAALSGHHRIVKHFCSQQHLLDKMAYKDIQKLFFMTIGNDMFDVALCVFKACPLELRTARDEEQLTALHMLARKPSTVLSMELEDDKVSGGSGIVLLREIWAEVGKLRREEISTLITEPSVALFDAINSENDNQVINTFLERIGIFTTVKDPKGRNPLHLLFLHRRYEIFKWHENEWKEQLRAVDSGGNNVLHLAAHLPPQLQSFSGLKASNQMLIEVKWFKNVERNIPVEFRSSRNKEGKRPVDVFYDEHNQLSKDIKETAKGIADSGMIVATLVATVAFAAALTVPGDKNNTWFIVFIFTNAVALFTSSASILSFLSNFTSSRFAQSEFVVSLHPSLTFGPVLLIISVAAMVLAFIAASFLIFAHKTKWVSYTVAPMGVFALLLFLLFQSKFCDDLFWSRYYRPKLE